MAYSFQKEVGNGVNRSFTMNFVGVDEGYIAEDDIQVTVNGAPAPFSFLSSNTIQLDTAPPLSSEVLIRRVMDKTKPYTDFRRGNNFGQEALNNSFLQALYTLHELLDGYFGEGTTIKQDIGFDKDVTISGKLIVDGIIEVGQDGGDSGVITTEFGDQRYLRQTGGTVDGNLGVNGNLNLSGNSTASGSSVLTRSQNDTRYLRKLNDAAQSLRVLGRMAVRDAQSPDEAASYGQLVAAAEGLTNQIAAIQDQLSDTSPLAASAFSPISWHAQTIDTSITIPPNSNAWSFGPDVTVQPGVVVTLSEGSFYTVANGEASSVEITGFDEGEI